jgi:hypothetical protein
MPQYVLYIQYQVPSLCQIMCSTFSIKCHHYATVCAVHSVSSAITLPLYVLYIQYQVPSLCHSMCCTFSIKCHHSATVCAVHSVSSATTHCNTKLQLQQSIQFCCKRNVTYKFEFNIFSKFFLRLKIRMVSQFKPR